MDSLSLHVVKAAYARAQAGVHTASMSAQIYASTYLDAQMVQQQDDLTV